jgi:hypothetical protein
MSDALDISDDKVGDDEDDVDVDVGGCDNGALHPPVTICPQ